MSTPSNAARARSSNINPATPGSAARPRVEAPRYEAMEYPLTSKAQRELSVLKAQSQLKEISAHLGHSRTALIEFASDINSKAYYKDYELERMHREHERRRKGHSSQAAVDEDEAEDGGAGGSTQAQAKLLKDLEVRNQEFKSKVRAMTDRMDASLRKTIDGQHAIQSVRDSLDETYSTTVANSQRVQQEQSQIMAQDGEEDVTQITATNRSRAAREIDLGPSPTETLRQKIQREQTKYQSMSLAQRYAKHNDYIEFKQRVHEAQHDPNQVPDVPNPRTWFPSENSQPLPGQTAIAGDEDRDEDIAVLQATISTKCPLTLVEFKEPVTSNKCKHSYEKSAILSLLDAEPRQGPRGRQAPKSVTCPVSGCSARIMASDLKENAALLRQIRRVQEHQRRAAELRRDNEDETQEGREQVLLDDSSVVGDDGEDIDALMEDEPAAKRRLKSEPRETAGRRIGGGGGARSQPHTIVDPDGDTDSD